MIDHGYDSDIEYFIELNNQKPSDPPPRLISEYIEKHRIMPSNTPFPGPFEVWRTQYVKEIMDCLSPYSSTRYCDIMASAQTIKSVTVENVVGYYIGAAPSPIVYVSGTDDLLKKWASKRLEPMIDSLGIRHKMVAQIESEHSRQSGDKAQQKLFTAGFLEMASAQSPSSLRADSCKLLILEECDSAPKLLTTGEGRWDLVAEARTKAWGARKKILAVSTPTLFDESIIYERFILGDQCEYLMPCPHCGKFQILQRGSEQTAHGLRADKKGGKLQFVYYLCDHCHEAIHEHHKSKMIIDGKWEPMAVAQKFRRSFHISGLCSPVGMYSWLDYWMDFEKALDDPDGMRSFINLQDGMPYREKGSRPKVENVITLRGNYRSGTVQDDVLFLTMSVDVQRGSKKDKNNPARLELEILGHAAKYRTASVVYKKFFGEIGDAYEGAWEGLHNWALETGLSFKRKDGKEFEVKLVFIDAGDGTSTNIVYEFCKRWQNTYPIMGFSALKKRKKEAGDEKSRDNFKRYRAAKFAGDQMVYEISTNYYKRNIYNNINNSIVAIINDEAEEKAGFCDFPGDYPDSYFQMLTAEERRRDGSFHLISGKRNESLDLRVYNMAAGDVYLDSMLMDYKAAAKNAGASPAEIQMIDHRFILRKLEKKVKKT